MFQLASSRRRFPFAITLLTLLAPGRIFAVSCKTQAQMTDADRAALVQAATTRLPLTSRAEIPRPSRQ